MSQPATYDLFRARKYFPELDGLRALSVLLVITVHMYDSGRLWWWLAGMRGVTVFFVLSGFLITTLGLREEEERGALSLSAFYVRRCCRLLPLYYLVLGIYCLCLFALGIAPALRATFAEALPWYLVYLQEVPFYSMLVVQMRDVPFFHSWSLGIEEKFYLVWPLLAFVVWRSPPRRRLLAAGSLWLLLTLAPFGLPLLSPHGRIVGRCLFAYSHILVGCILALMLHERLWFARLRFLGRRSCAALVSLAFLAIHFATPWLAEPAPSGYAWHALYAVACGTMLTAVVLGDGSWQRCLRIGAAGLHRPAVLWDLSRSCPGDDRRVSGPAGAVASVDGRSSLLWRDGRHRHRHGQPASFPGRAPRHGGRPALVALATGAGRRPDSGCIRSAQGVSYFRFFFPLWNKSHYN